MKGKLGVYFKGSIKNLHTSLIICNVTGRSPRASEASILLWRIHNRFLPCVTGEVVSGEIPERRKIVKTAQIVNHWRSAPPNAHSRVH